MTPNLGALYSSNTLVLLKPTTSIFDTGDENIRTINNKKSRITQSLRDASRFKVTQHSISPTKVRHTRVAALESTLSNDGSYLLSSAINNVDVTQSQRAKVTQPFPSIFNQSRSPNSSTVTLYLTGQQQLHYHSNERKNSNIQAAISMPISRNTLITQSPLREFDNAKLSRYVAGTAEFYKLKSSGFSTVSNVLQVEVQVESQMPNTRFTQMSIHSVTQRDGIITQSSAVTTVIQHEHYSTGSSRHYIVHNVSQDTKDTLEQEATPIAHTANQMSHHLMTKPGNKVTQSSAPIQVIRYLQSRTETGKDMKATFSSSINVFRTSSSLEDKAHTLRYILSAHSFASSVSVTPVSGVFLSITDSVTGRGRRCQEGQHKRHPVFCTFFMQCSQGKWFEQRCGPGTVFNPVKNVCDWIRNVQC